VNTSVGALLNEPSEHKEKEVFLTLVKFGDPHAIDRKRNSNWHIAE